MKRVPAIAGVVALFALAAALHLRCSSLEDAGGKKDKDKNDDEVDSADDGTDANGEGAGEDTGQTDGSVDPAAVPFRAKIKSFTYDSEGDNVNLLLSSEHCNHDLKVDIRFDDACMESFPVQCRGELVSVPAADFGCDHEAPVETEITVSVAHIKDRPASLGIRSGDDPMVSLLIGKVGDLKALDDQLKPLFASLTGLPTEEAAMTTYSACAQDSDCVTANWLYSYGPMHTCATGSRSCDGFKPGVLPQCSPKGVLMNAETKAKLAKFYEDDKAKELCESAKVLTIPDCGDASCAATPGEPKCVAGQCAWVE